ncbi:hypothetical protein A3K29_02520 [Candidatus Collierbacteria bacterium RIFOXYB2_FULL_46_14]|uniref:Uncharacterized protein n=1 Tax=Candidatus Collierbacteria bacterium GW2011_GWA2_46_26 TaxID=1618381 RepID=A0A0G1PMB4_9BACT|nr:MAG: hypothetical protein UW29_C0004G0009 [Candidatus Collierbacteria bacterium GW2011_GWC2_44_13]KKU33939.1 MAG: hypothetical protein UX47_C0001G0222 [Candidatus Collierbacteria bacterium GW2011_GWA2_46_26]OGD72994.1 MAG: hypothetical protein A3K29_02520 [Candidatus Collierbacteria bacterium RIFOXYB2_FULL_46_14]OGD76036.1 MAG: hypothetical protein A3K43_02520 [Candidatus Collierbacteria bacterium RIFOXYA2_FULL_46_20]OGD77372.1 MAG: hypothetical protein A3K39_02520 [Candidatus Collierbacteri
MEEIKENIFQELWPGEKLLSTGNELPVLPQRPDMVTLTHDHSRSLVIMDSRRRVLAWYPAGHILDDRETDYDTEKLEADIISEIARRDIPLDFTVHDLELSKEEQDLLSGVKVFELEYLTGGVRVSFKDDDTEEDG